MKTHNWSLDAKHSEVYFKVRHLLISSVTGSFRQFTGRLLAADMDTFEGATLEATLDVYSIDTNETDRDEHLKTPEFLDADSFPEIKLNGTNFRHVSGDRFDFDAELTVKGTSKTIPMQLNFGGETKDGFGNHRAGVELVGKINRKDFGIHYSATTDAGGLVIGEEVTLSANLQFVREA
ncbi:YceI family protein [Flavobacterium silvaticum]|uniref:YceI family protein n=1 Tax=Flavobacterium silvaticum TaxID=1852020 RepID=A0A972FV12_9FLAO|nr:YceI family protein [Flavobacterium silvaticum]NMH28130.1 YceI family protein [Flavobacterium silvaticum]